MVLNQQFGYLSQHLTQILAAVPKVDAFSQLWGLVKGVIALRPITFQTLQNQPHSLPAALTIVFIAGIAQSLSQIVVLFINQVRPLRFILSLVISAILFVVGFGFWALSTWVMINTVFNSYLPLSAVIRTIGFSYAPLMLGLFVVMPYFGSAVFILLSIWTLLAVVVGIDTISTLALWEAFGSVALGWIGIQLIQKTVGQPIASLGQWIINWVAGEDLIRNRNRLAEELYAGLRTQIAGSDSLSQTQPVRPSNVPFHPRK
ncbi:hypothetical protein IQ256_01530 [cf. Phormidesmis sp. LEGE 11477]|nr:hypothetical protein [cf. Phormidesmis sp. LEGE 11477]